MASPTFDSGAASPQPPASPRRVAGSVPATPRARRLDCSEAERSAGPRAGQQAPAGQRPAEGPDCEQRG